MLPQPGGTSPTHELSSKPETEVGQVSTSMKLVFASQDLLIPSRCRLNTVERLSAKVIPLSPWLIFRREGLVPQPYSVFRAVHDF